MAKTPTRTKSTRKHDRLGAKSQASAPPEMTLEEIEAAHQLLQDKNYLQDKSVKKPSLATLKRRKRQKEQEEKDMAIAQTEPTTKSSYKSAMNQKDQLNSIQALKDAYRQKASTNRDEKFQIQIEKEKKPHSSVFSGKMNQEFLK